MLSKSHFAVIHHSENALKSLLYLWNPQFVATDGLPCDNVLFRNIDA